MEIVTKVMEKSWKSHGNLLVKMCTNPGRIGLHPTESVSGLTSSAAATAALSVCAVLSASNRA